MQKYLDKYRNKKRCLFVNVSETSFKLINGYKLNKLYKPIIYSNDHLKDIGEYVRRLNIKIVIIDNTRVNHISEKNIEILSSLKMIGVEVLDAQHFYEILNRRVSLVKFNPHKYHVDDIFSIGISPSQAVLKRFLDLFAAVLCIPIALPLILLGISFVKISSKGNAFFIQERIGENSKPFYIYKIRTMEDIVNMDGSVDKKITRVGKLLRQTKIDELPQLYNIFNGDMSLIGPRPETYRYVIEAVNENAFFNLRHLIKPGITGWAQVHLPKATPKDNLKKLEFDLYYIKNYSILLDIETIMRTIRIILTMNSN
ncbi:sugar transferase [Chryseobacterium wangxinyae]|uniref:sugar transferase n=1 Tax=Chryseobacterium sp. CY350 TaxID=2997336 RepID=UPI00227134AA|nr:sugar transferase [Chryseobacterium sp. CY350]MCY0977107.1 sugar transferase [Chryseobacterium sp. CY350]WBZ97104.1 sugar transferase [Chryseobacterium sp. CY350]